MNRGRNIAFSALLLAGGCGIGHADTLKDGYRMLRDADDVLNVGRVGRARYYVEQALPIFEQGGDKSGLADAYREYGLVALYGGFNADNPTILIRHPNEPVTPGAEELDLSDRYFLRALPLFDDAGSYFMASNVDFLLARNSAIRGDNPQACTYYDAAIAAYDKGKAALPDAVPETAKGFTGTAREGFVEMKKRVCAAP